MRPALSGTAWSNPEQEVPKDLVSLCDDLRQGAVCAGIAQGPTLPDYLK